MEYTLRRSRRKSWAIEVRGGEVIVRGPMSLGRAAADRLVDGHRDWIERKLTEFALFRAAHPSRKVEFGGRFPIFGVEYELKEGVRNGFDGAFRLHPDRAADMPEALRKLYRELAKKLLPPKIEARAAAHGLTLGGVGISGARKRWGSCSQSGRVMLSWRLLLLPEELADFVIAHELAHLEEHNHSRSFYRVLEEIEPEWRVLEAKLKRIGLAQLDDWI